MKFIGLTRLGQDAEIRYTAKGTPVASLNLAYNYGRKGDDGNRPTQWVQGAMFGQRAEKMAEGGYLTKGTALVVTLSDVHIEEFERRDGTHGSALRAVVDDFEFAGGRDKQRPAQQEPPDDSGVPEDNLPF